VVGGQHDKVGVDLLQCVVLSGGREGCAVVADSWHVFVFHQGQVEGEVADHEQGREAGRRTSSDNEPGVRPGVGSTVRLLSPSSPFIVANGLSSVCRSAWLVTMVAWRNSGSPSIWSMCSRDKTAVRTWAMS
jgi:hypothetical protein